MAKRILSIPTSSAASERNWLAFTYIHDKKHNRLTPDRVLKLVYIYSNYKLQMPKEIKEWKGLLDELNKTTLIDKNNANNIDNTDDEIQIPIENEENDDKDEYLLSSESESESENENESGNETDKTN